MYVCITLILRATRVLLFPSSHYGYIFSQEGFRVCSREWTEVFFVYMGLIFGIHWHHLEIPFLRTADHFDDLPEDLECSVHDDRLMLGI